MLPESSVRALPSRRAIAWTMAAALALFAIIATATLVITGGRGAGASASGPSLGLDLWAARHVAALRAPAVTPVAWFFTETGSTVGLTILTSVVVVALALRGRRAEALILALSISGSAILTTALKELFNRPRLDHELLLGSPAHSAAFPSGHSLNTVVFSGLLAGFALISASSRGARAGAVVTAVALPAAVGASRLYLGYHRLTEVLAGWAVGLAWVCATALVVIALSRQRERAIDRTPRVPAQS